MFDTPDLEASVLERILADRGWALPVPPPSEEEDDDVLAVDDASVRSGLVELIREGRWGAEADPLLLGASPLPGGGREAAIEAQARLLEAERVERLADARRVVSLITAYEVSIEDLRVRFGSEIGTRGGVGAQAFFKSVGIRMQMNPLRVAHQIDVSLIARDRLPQTWSAFLSGGTTWQRVAIAVKQAEGLDTEHWPAYDRFAADRIGTDTRLKDSLHRQRERLQDDTAAARTRTTHERRAVYFDKGPDGAATLSATGAAPRLLGNDLELTRLAVLAHGVDGNTDTVTQLRSDLFNSALEIGLKIIADSMQGGAKALQRIRRPVRLVLTVPALQWLGKTTEQAILEGYGPIDPETAKDLAGAATSMVRVLTDPITGVRLTMDRKVYAPPADLRRWIQIRDGRSRFPGGRRPAWLSDIDHAREWQHGGDTDEWNLVALARPDHLAKSLGLFQEELRRDGIVHWHGPWGEEFDDPPNDPMDPAPRDLLPPATDDGNDCPF